MDILIVAFTIFWVIRIGGNLLTYIHLWWVKEYRFDRMLVHLRTAQGKRIFWPSFRRPPLTPKTVSLMIATGVSLLSLFYVIRLPLVGKLIIIDLATFPVSWIWVGLLNLPIYIYHQVLISAAVHKLRVHQTLLAVGITGSYGKTSTKDYLATLLATKYKTLKTEASKNSPIGIAEVILKKLKPDTQVFVVEMGAYKRGEISEMSQMVRPEIGIVTAINPQHQDLFGSIENTMKAKYELLSGLSGKKIAILNADDRRVWEIGEWAKRDGREVWWWTKEAEKGKRKKANGKIFRATNIKSDFSGVAFDCVLEKEKVAVAASVLGEHQVGNILAAIAAAVACGMTLPEAAKAVSLIRPASKVMEFVSGINGSIFINDTFNNNPDAARAALDFLSQAKGKKIFVFQPMIELGDYAEKSHVEVGEYAGRICDDIILTNNNWYEDFLGGVRRISASTPVLVLTPPKAAEYVSGKVKKGDMVVFKGKEAEHVLKLLQR